MKSPVDDCIWVALQRTTLLFLFGMLLCAPAMAVNCVSISNGVDPPIVVCDGDPGDDNSFDDEILVHFTLEDPIGDDWVATGDVLATTTPSGATLVVTNTTIQNLTGQQVNGQMFVSHSFPPLVSFTQQYVAHIDGSFDKIGGGVLGNFQLFWNASYTGGPLGGQNFMAALVPGPVFFDWDGLPHHVDTVIQQDESFIFYIDELDNTINLFDSATILPLSTVSVQDAAWSGIKQIYR